MHFTFLLLLAFIGFAYWQRTQRIEAVLTGVVFILALFGCVLLHEFGHALGLVHEHQSPAADIPWDLETLYTYFAGPPNYWSPAQVDYNIIRRYEHDQTNFSAFDPMSIMLYPISPAFTGGKLSIEWNRTLSVTDREFIGQLYPAPGE